MPELPEVEQVRHHLEPLLKGRKAGEVRVFKPRLIRPNTLEELRGVFQEAKFQSVKRRGKYLLFTLKKIAGKKEERMVLGHLGMTGRMYIQSAIAPLPKHAVVAIALGTENFIFEDTRGFGRFTLQLDAIATLGPEPLEKGFDEAYLEGQLAKSTQPIKVKLLDQTLVAGVGNIYANEALFHAGISPLTPCNKLTGSCIGKLQSAINKVIHEAIELGRKLPLHFVGTGKRENSIFYYGIESGGREKQLKERFTVYDREGQPCVKCKSRISRIEQVGRSTYYCPKCQSSEKGLISIDARRRKS
jgi:formamidopyrimidine-DNA glycosylase